MLVPVLLFLLGLVLLIKGGDWFVEGAVGIAHRFHLSEILIGATIVSIGTTLPEVMVSSQAALMGNSGISYGNAIGSIICNTALIAALSAAIRPSKVDRSTLLTPTIVYFVAAGIYALTAWIRGGFSRLNGIIFLAIFVVYMIVLIKQGLSNPDTSQKDTSSDEDKPLWPDLIRLAVGAAVIAVGANLLVNNGTKIAQALGVPDSVIGLTFVALGTSLPELVTAITSLAKGHSALSLGNVIGANIFNIVLVSGMAITISPFKIPAEKTIGSVNSSLIIDIPLMLIVMGILTIPTIIRGRLKRWQGCLLLGIYVVFTAYQFMI